MIDSLLHYINENKSLKDRYREIKNWYVVETNKESFFHNKYCTPEQLESPYLLCNELNTGDKIVAEVGIHSYVATNLVWFIDEGVNQTSEKHDVIKVNIKFSFYDNETDSDFENPIRKIIEITPYQTEKKWLHECYGTAEAICNKFISNLYYNQLFKIDSWKYIPVRIRKHEWNEISNNQKAYGFFHIEPFFFLNDEEDKVFYYDSVCELIEAEEINEIIFKEDFELIELKSPKWENSRLLLIDYFISDGLVMDEDHAVRSGIDE